MNPRLSELRVLAKELADTVRKAAEIARTIEHLSVAMIAEGRESLVDLIADADLGELLAEAEALSLLTLDPHKLRHGATRALLETAGALRGAMLRDLLVVTLKGTERGKLTTKCTCSECQKPKAPCDCPVCKLTRAGEATPATKDAPN
jgi:hypothetical protein